VSTSRTRKVNTNGWTNSACLTGISNPNRFERFLIKPLALLEVIGWDNWDNHARSLLRAYK
jgi:hypothetical protein